MATQLKYNPTSCPLPPELIIIIMSNCFMKNSFMCNFFIMYSIELQNILVVNIILISNMNLNEMEDNLTHSSVLLKFTCSFWSQRMM